MNLQWKMENNLQPVASPQLAQKKSQGPRHMWLMLARMHGILAPIWGWKLGFWSRFMIMSMNVSALPERSAQCLSTSGKGSGNSGSSK